MAPEIASQWHPTRNGSVRPSDIVAGTRKKYWWKCPEAEDHVWQAAPGDRMRGQGCPFCSERKLSKTNSLAAVSPELVSQWAEQNAPLRPDMVRARSARVVWWKCPKDPSHVYQARIDARVYEFIDCPFCAGQRLHETTTLRAKCPELAAQWHPIRNGELSPDDVYFRTKRHAWWQCPKNPDHVWRAEIASRVRGAGCPFCAGVQTTPATSLAVQMPELAREWNYERNGDLLPIQVRAGSGKKVWWRCSANPKHEWEARICSRKHGRGCPLCKAEQLSERNRARAKARREV